MLGRRLLILSLLEILVFSSSGALSVGTSIPHHVDESSLRADLHFALADVVSLNGNSSSTNMTGTWRTNSGDVVRILQKNNGSFSSTFVNDTSCTGPEHPTNRSYYINGAIHGLSATGQMQRCTPEGINSILVKNCGLPDLWTTPFNATIGPSGSEIPRSAYTSDFLTDDTLPNGSAHPDEVVPTVDIVMPNNGTYTLRVMGTGLGNYSIDFLFYDNVGHSYTEQINGTATPTSLDIYRIQYTDARGSHVQIAKVSTLTTAGGEESNTSSFSSSSAMSSLTFAPTSSSSPASALSTSAAISYMAVSFSIIATIAAVSFVVGNAKRKKEERNRSN